MRQQEEQEQRDRQAEEDRERAQPRDRRDDLAPSRPGSDRDNLSNDDNNAQDPQDDQEDDQPPAGPALVQLIPSQAQYRIGDTVIVEVLMQNATNVGSTPFHLRYNPAVLEFVSPAAEGALLKSDGANTVFLATPTGGGGELVVGLSRMGAGQGANGTGSLAVFQFRAIGAGDCGFAFTGAAVKDPQARNLPAAFNAAAVRVVE